MRLATEAANIYSWEVDLENQKAIYAANTEHVLGFMMPADLADSIALIHEDDRRTAMEKFEQAIANQTRYDTEFRIVNPRTGESIWQSTQGIFINHGRDKARRFVGITQNVTERKQAEQEREELLRREQSARREAEEASRLKDEFLATVSHELRTPLNAILGWSQMLRSGRVSQSDMSHAVDTIYRNAKSQAQLIEDILDVSRIITGKIRLEPRPISLAPVIQSAVETLRPAIEAKNIRLQMRLDFEPRTVYADPDRLQQVVWNLLSNAMKFTPEKGQVTIELAADEAETKIIVSDTGRGISAEFLPFVFERFRQADGSSTRQHGGLGLGLAIVRHIVELHGGSVEAASRGENAGTTFTVRLPLSESTSKVKELNKDILWSNQASVAGAQSITGNNRIKGLRVLLVDDEVDTLDLLGVVLSQNGAKVKARTSARDALEIIKEWQPDVIVSDIAMPEEDGYSFIKKLRALPPDEGGAIPVVALTAYVGIKQRTEVLSNGFQMYVPKPVEPSELLEALASFKRETI
jgi:signal transduction histidine kinase/ActR/RegA family two-component response regulator